MLNLYFPLDGEGIEEVTAITSGMKGQVLIIFTFSVQTYAASRRKGGRGGGGGGVPVSSSLSNQTHCVLSWLVCAAFVCMQDGDL